MRVSELSQLLGAVLAGDPSRDISGVAALENAGPEDLSFADSTRSLTRASGSRAGCILVMRGSIVPGHTTLAVENPKLALVHAAELLLPAEKPRYGVHPSAVVDAAAVLNSEVSIAAHAVIEGEVSIGAGSSIGAGAYVGWGASIGENCVIYPRVTIYPGARIGNRVILHAGVVIGSDG